MSPKALFGLLKEAAQDWLEDKTPQLAAALAFYTVLSLAPLLTLMVTVAGLVFGQEAAKGEIVGQIEGLVGSQGAQTIQTAIENSNKPDTSRYASLISFAVLIFSASNVFAQLQDTLNRVWELEPKPGRGIINFIKKRILSFTAVLGIAFLLIISLVLSAGLSAFGNILGNLVPIPSFIWQLINFIVSFIIITFLFGLIYKFIPDAIIAWKDVWVGAAVTSLLFAIGKFALGLYIAQGSFGSAYGAAGSLVIILVWVYYSAQILFFGAEVTQAYARRRGAQIVPDEDAQRISD